MKTVGKAKFWLKENLKKFYASDELDSVVFLVLNSITKLSPTQLRISPEKELSDNQIQMLLLSAKKLQSEMPVQYVLGEAEFFGLKFEVNSSVLIPRPETEELVAWVLEEKGNLSGNARSREREKPEAESSMPKAILDIGTGSGCIPIAIKKNWPEAVVSGLDISEDALQTAQKNALINEVEVGFFQQDVLNFMPIKEAPAYSVIVSNPPYITPKEQQQMHNNVLDFEPHLALFVPENDPLLFYRAIADYASFTLQKNGSLFFEINENYGEQVVEMLIGKSFVDVKLRKDLNGKDRMIKARRI